MRSIIHIILVFSFSLSVVAGESLCCNEGDLTLQKEVLVDSHSQSENEEFSATSVSAICDHSNDPNGKNHSQEHQCVGCSHTPFLNCSISSFAYVELSEIVQFKESDFPLLSPFFDGPFHPPKYNS